MKEMTADHLLSGIIGVLAKRGYTTVSIRTDQVDVAMQKVFSELLTLAPSSGIDVEFQITRDLHGNAPIVREAIARAAQRDLVSLDNPEYQDMRFTGKATRLNFDRLPGGRQLYEKLADTFIDNYEARTTATA